MFNLNCIYSITSFAHLSREKINKDTIRLRPHVRRQEQPQASLKQHHHTYTRSLAAGSMHIHKHTWP